MATLLDLPVHPLDRDAAGYTDIIEETYTTERPGIITLADLTAFINRWRAIWELVCPYHPDLKTGHVPVANETVVALLPIMGDKDFAGPFDGDNPDHVATINLLLPPAFLHAHVVASEYGVSSDLALVRLFLDPYPELDGELR